MRVLVHSPGPPDHGAIRHARTISALVARRGVEVVERGPADLTHTQFTDALWGADIASAAASYGAWAARTPRPLIVTLHDVPGADRDTDRDLRRCDGYRRVIAASDAVIVSSRHEATKADRLGDRAGRFIELPLDTPAPPAPKTWPDWPPGATIGILGFLYPGKGHGEVIRAAAHLSPPPIVVSLGAVSPGHSATAVRHQGDASLLGVRLVVTGALPDRRLATAMRDVTVPVMSNRAASASASLLTWLGSRRRPLVAAGAYGCEIDSRHPGSVELYDGPDELDAAIARALADPGRTWLPEALAWPDTGSDHVDAYRSALGAARTFRAPG